MSAALITAGCIAALGIAVFTAWAAWDRHQEAEWLREEGQAPLQRGRHRAPKPQPAIIERQPTGHAPPRMHAPVAEPETEIPGLVTRNTWLGPELMLAERPPPDAYFLAAGTVADGQVTFERVALLPPVAALLGHDSVDAALDSIFTRAMQREVRALTDGAP